MRCDPGDDILVFQADAQGRITHAAQNALPHRALEKLEWYASPNFQLPLIGISMLLLVSTLPIAGIRLLRRRVQVSRLASLAWRILVVEAVMMVLFVLGFAFVFLNQAMFVRGDVLLLRAVLVLPVLMLILTPIAITGVIMAWRKGYWGFVMRGYYTIVTIASVILLWTLHFWNLLGWRF